MNIVWNFTPKIMNLFIALKKVHYKNKLGHNSISKHSITSVIGNTTIGL